MKTIILKNGNFGNKPTIRLEFPFDFELKELVKTFPGCEWDPKQKVWWVPYTEDQFKGILRFFKGKAWLDYSQFQAVKLSPSYPELPPLTEVIICEVKAFEDWMRSKRYSESTIKTYMESIGIFFRYLNNKPLKEIDNEDFEKFNKEYIIERGYSASFQNQIVNALKLFFRNRQQRKLNIELIYRPKRAKILPNVLSKEEVKAILDAHSNIKHSIMLALIYSCGLRRSELLSLKPTDIDSKRKLVIIRQSKGKKDRVVPFVREALAHPSPILLVVQTRHMAFRRTAQRRTIQCKKFGKRVEAGLSKSTHKTSRYATLVTPQLCNPFVGVRNRSAVYPGLAGTQKQ